MVEPRRIALGRLSVHGEEIGFEPMPSGAFWIHAGESVELTVPFSYREASRHEEAVRLVFWAEIDGRKLGPDEREIGDERMRMDDVRSFLAVSASKLPEGAHAGRYHVMAKYARGEWDASSKEEWVLERSGDFTIEVRARSHRI